MADKINFELAFPFQVTNWDGEIITLKSRDYLLKKIELFKKLNISWVVIGGFQIEEALGFNIREGAEFAGNILKENGLKVASHHCILPTFASLDGSQDKVREKMKKTIDFCSLLNTENLVLHPGELDGAHRSAQDNICRFELEEQKYGIDKILATVSGNLNFMGKYAAGFGLKIAVENLGRFTPLGSFDHLPKLITGADLPNVGYCLDTGHAHAFGESVERWMDVMGDKLFTTHFHDNRARLAYCKSEPRFTLSTKSVDEHLSPGFGTINWQDIIKKLRSMDFKQPVSFETGGWPGYDEVESYERAISWWRTCEALAAESD